MHSTFQIRNSEFLTIDSIQGNSLKISLESLSTIAKIDDAINNSLMLKNGFDLLCENKVGIVLVMSGNNSPTEKSIDELQNFLLDDERFRKVSTLTLKFIESLVYFLYFLKIEFNPFFS